MFGAVERFFLRQSRGLGKQAILCSEYYSRYRVVWAKDRVKQCELLKSPDQDSLTDSGVKKGERLNRVLRPAN